MVPAIYNTNINTMKRLQFIKYMSILPIITACTIDDSIYTDTFTTGSYQSGSNS